jgi:hypothetical protein
MKLIELRALLNRPYLSQTAEVHIAPCPNEAMVPCPIIGVAYSGIEVHAFCAHRESAYPDETRVVSYMEKAAQEIAAAGHLPIAEARLVVQDAVRDFNLDVAQPINWDVAHATVGEGVSSNVPE